MTIKIEINARGDKVIWGENRGGKMAPLPADTIFIRASDGHVFKAGSIPGPLGRLEPHEPDMVRHWLRETDGPHKPDIFAGEPPAS